MSIEKRKLSRREFIAGIAAASAAAAGAASKVEKIYARPDAAPEVPANLPEQPSEQAPEEGLGFLDVEPHPRLYDMGALAGQKLSDLFSFYTGIDGLVSERMPIDFKYQKARMQKSKLTLMKTATGYPDQAVRVARRLMSHEHDASEFMAIAQYRDRIERAIAPARLRDMNSLKQAPAFSSFSDDQIALVKKFETAVNADILLAYSTTELMPTKGENAKAGVQVYDFLLRNAGASYVESIPAMHDKLVSWGPYQHTRYSVGPDGGASIIDALSDHPLLPREAGELAGDQHHQAAYLLAVYNFAQLVRQLGPNASSDLLASFDSMPKSHVMQYVAAAHHLPGAARKAFEGYASDLVAYERAKDGQASRRHASQRAKHLLLAPDFLARCDAHKVGEYARKTADNAAALELTLASLRASR